jgi:hypothetical protein
MRLSTLIVFFSIVAFTLCGCTVPAARLVDDANNQLLNRSKNALCLSIDTLHVTYMDNTKAIADTLFNDSFFIEAANGLLLYEVSKNFGIRQWTPQDSLLDSSSGAAQDKSPDADSLAVFRRGGFSKLAGDTASLFQIASRIRELAIKYNADLVVIPYACMIKHITVRPTGWRNDKYTGPGYDRPISYTAKTDFHVQIWDKNGTLLYERIGKSDTGRPILYSFLKKEKHPDKDIVKYAKRFYAPPLVKSLYNSIKIAMQVRM